MNGKDTRLGFYVSVGKRLFDLFVAAFGVILLLPVFVLVGLLVKFTSVGPIFYRQERAGKDGCSFRIVKFRTMQVDADRCGLHITVSGDPRVTPLGRILRKLKIDELPQLWNVLKGEMSLVGPRPEAPVYVKSYSDEQRQVLRVRPGITDLASIAYRHEEEILAAQENTELYYLQVILPHKLSLNARYVGNISLKYDLLVLAKTLACLLSDKAEYLASFSETQS